MTTTTPAGTPHVVPVWDLWLEEGLHFGTAPETRMGRNLARDNPDGRGLGGDHLNENLALPQQVGQGRQKPRDGV